MIGGLLQAARNDAAAIAVSGGFQVTAILSKPDGTNPLTVTGLATGTWAVMDDTMNGKPVNTSSNSFNIPLQTLIDSAYPFNEQYGRINLNKHRVTMQDPDGKMGGNYVIVQSHPNTTLGLLICILGRSE